MTDQPIKFGQIQNPYREFTYTIPALGKERVDYAFSYWRVLALSGGELEMRFGGSGEYTPVSGSGLGQQLDQPIPFLEIRNADAVNPMTITIAMAIGKIDDDRLNVVGTGIDVVTGSGDDLNTDSALTINTGAGQLAVASNSNNRRIWIYNNDASAIIYVGDVNVDATDGMPIPPKSYAILETADAIYLTSDTASTDVRIMREGKA